MPDDLKKDCEGCDWHNVSIQGYRKPCVSCKRNKPDMYVVNESREPKKHMCEKCIAYHEVLCPRSCYPNCRIRDDGDHFLDGDEAKAEANRRTNASNRGGTIFNYYEARMKVCEGRHYYWVIQTYP